MHLYTVSKFYAYFFKPKNKIFLGLVLILNGLNRERFFLFFSQNLCSTHVFRPKNICIYCPKLIRFWSFSFKFNSLYYIWNIDKKLFLFFSQNQKTRAQLLGHFHLIFCGAFAKSYFWTYFSRFLWFLFCDTVHKWNYDIRKGLKREYDSNYRI